MQLGGGRDSQGHGFHNLHLKKMSTHIYVYVYICVCIYIHICMHAKALLSCLTLCNSTDCGPPSSSVSGILPARKLEWVAVLFPTQG